jgi:hypothetical protein
METWQDYSYSRMSQPLDQLAEYATLPGQNLVLPGGNFYVALKTSKNGGDVVIVGRPISNVKQKRPKNINNLWGEFAAICPITAGG